MALSPGSPAEADSAGYVPEFEVALESGNVTFDHVVSAYHANTTDPTSTGAEIFENYYLPLRTAYEEQSGGVAGIWFGRSPLSGVARTKSGDLIVNVPPSAGGEVEVLALVQECEHVNREAARTLEGPDRERCQVEVFELVATLLGYLDERAALSPDERATTLKGLEARRDAVVAVFQASAQRSAQLTYFGGTLIGVLVTTVAATIAAVAAVATDPTVVSADQLIVSFAAGGVGGWVSVLCRFSFRRVKLDSTADPKHLRNLGVVRPIIGAIFGIAIYCLFGSGIVPVTVPETGEPRLLFYGFVGFASGFSERWAQDMLVLGETRLSRSAGGPDSGQGTAGTADSADDAGVDPSLP